MTEAQYFGDEPEEENELDIDQLRKTIRSDFIRDLEMTEAIVSAFPLEWRLPMLINIMKDM